MPRPEKPIDAGGGAVAEFALRLRALRDRAGRIPYRTLATMANYSADVLSRAAAGRVLPTWQVVQAYVRACGGDEAEWRAYWEAARSAPREPPRNGHEL